MISKQLSGFLVAISLLSVGCSGTSRSTEEVQLTVSAASSLTDAMNEIEQIYEEQQS